MGIDAIGRGKDVKSNGNVPNCYGKGQHSEGIAMRGLARVEHGLAEALISTAKKSSGKAKQRAALARQ